MSWTTVLRRAAFQRSGGHWLFYVTALYAMIALYSTFIEPVASIVWIQLAWLLICSLPLYISPLARFLKMKTIWE